MTQTTPRIHSSSSVHALLLLSALLALLTACGKDKDQKAVPDATPVAVSTMTVQARTVPITGEFTGRTDSQSTVELRARISGVLRKILFKEGSLVKAGDLLFVIDPVEQQNAMAKSAADVSRAKALLDNARKDRARFDTLVKQGVVSQQEYDAKVTNERQLAADVAAMGAAASEARTTLGYTKIIAPQAGRIGRSNFKVGNLVGPGENSLLASISATDTFSVTFNISERDYLLVADEYVEAKAKGVPPPSFKALVILADERVYPHEGVIDMADRAIDPTTGTLPVRAVFPNPEGIIKPGLFAKVRVHLGELDNATLVPEQAVSDIQGARSVFVVGRDGKAENRPVTLGPRVETSYVVQKGLAPGDVVIVDGWQKVRTGTPVTQAPAAAPPPAPTAAPPATPK